MARQRDSDDRLETIRGLLAKAEATTFPAEAESLVAKATELMSRYAIDEAMVWADGGSDREQPDELTLVVQRPFTGQKALLVAGIAQAFHCQAIRLGARKGADRELISIVGFPADLSLVETLVTSLFVQLTTAMTSDPSHPTGVSASQVSSWRRSFITSFSMTVVGRVEQSQAMAKAEQDASAAAASASRGATSAAEAAPNTPRRSTDLVLAERSDEVASDFRRRYPNVRTSRISTGTSRSGSRAGQSAGHRADIGHSRLSPRKALPNG